MAPFGLWLPPAKAGHSSSRVSSHDVVLMLLQAAVEGLNGATLHGASIEVEPAHEVLGSADISSPRSCSIFVKGFGPEARLSMGPIFT